MASTQSHSSTQKLTPKPAVFVTMDFDITTNEPNPVELVAMNCRNLTSETFELKNESQWRLAIHFINRELILEQRRSENYYPTAVTVSSLEKSILTEKNVPVKTFQEYFGRNYLKQTFEEEMKEAESNEFSNLIKDKLYIIATVYGKYIRKKLLDWKML
ncbi:hypothetical protein AVEN_57371-1 [Araneus ventricosus]|uniref:Uncharacterized protein n=1 Tax=Araneus ventricosus TaxID=182803 RepID=A0A4Y2S7J8_ARAVE|nr:hypothetical protein AVEN_57371-1 [Araneus ventricosus]